MIASKPGDDFNAIDPNFVADRDGGAWLAFGSFWKRVEAGAARSHDRQARRSRCPAGRHRAARTWQGCIEAAFVVDHGGWYWLLASFDHCCRGAKSDYHDVVGRARSITGPYVDRARRTMLAGGGTDLVAHDPCDPVRFKRPGHAGFLHDRDGRDYLVFHAYDADTHGTPTLRIARLRSSMICPAKASAGAMSAAFSRDPE